MLSRQILSVIGAIFLVLPSRADWARDQIGLTQMGPQDCSGVVIAYIDTGVNTDSPYLQNAIWTNPSPTRGDVHGYDFVHQSGIVRDLDGHGTEVAHVIAADTKNSDTTGVCSKAQIMPLKIMESGNASIESIKSALDYAIEKKANIILMTTGLIIQSGLPPFGIKNQIAKATRNGAIFIHAAANLSDVPARGATHPHQLWPFLIPERFHPIPNAISVGGSTYADLPWLGGFRYPSKVHVAAPAEDIQIIDHSGEEALASGNSLAAGIAAGMAAAYWTANPSRTASEVIEALKSTSVKGGAYLREMQSGRLDLVQLITGQEEPIPSFVLEGQKPLEGGTDHPYYSPQKNEWTFQQPGASYVRVVFSYINLGNCWDLQRQTKVTILNGHGNPVQEFVCENLAPGYMLPSVFVEGEKLTVVFEAHENQNLFRSGFEFRFLEWGRRE